MLIEVNLYLDSGLSVATNYRVEPYSQIIENVVTAKILGQKVVYLIIYLQVHLKARKRFLDRVLAPLIAYEFQDVFECCNI